MYLVSCAVPIDECSPELLDRVEKLGLTPILTTCVVRTIYEGDDAIIADTLKEIYERERNPDIYYHDTTVVSIRESKAARREARKAARRERKARENAKLHGYK